MYVRYLRHDHARPPRLDHIVHSTDSAVTSESSTSTSNALPSLLYLILVYTLWRTSVLTSDESSQYRVCRADL